MRLLKWSISNAVSVAEIDDEHKEIFGGVANLQSVLTSGSDPLEVRKRTQRLTWCILGHFAHEERLMRASRYGSMRWHKQSHDAARKRVGDFVLRIEQGDAKAGLQLIEYLNHWLHDHTRLADRMLGAFLRNQRCVGKLTLRAGTKPMEACGWVTANGDRLNPQL